MDFTDQEKQTLALFLRDKCKKNMLGTSYDFTGIIDYINWDHPDITNFVLSKKAAAQERLKNLEEKKKTEQKVLEDQIAHVEALQEKLGGQS